MSTRRFVEELEYGNANGLDTTNPVSMMSPGFVREARNVNLGTTGGYIKRDGYTSVLTTAWSGGLAIRQGIEYRAAGGSTQVLLYGTDDSSTAKIGRVSGGAVSDLVTGISAVDRPNFVQVEDRLFMFNGDSTNAPFVFEGGATTRGLGFAKPTVDPTGSDTTGGSLDVGNYVYAYSYARVDGSGRVVSESSLSATVTVEVESPNNQVDLTVTASADSNVTSIRIYRTVVNGSVLFLESTIANTTGTHNSTAADNELGTTQAPLDNSQLGDFSGYDKAKFPVVARNRLFVAHENRNEVRFSKIADDGPLPEVFPALNFSSVEGRKGAKDSVVGLGQITNVPIVLKENSVGRLEEVGLPQIEFSEDNVTYIYREISDHVGAVDHNAQTQVFEELVFLGKDNIYATNGQTVRPVANQIQSTIKSLDFRSTRTKFLSMMNDTKNRRIYISVFENTGATEPQLVLVGDYDQYPNFRWTTYAEGDDNSTHPGMRVGSFFTIANTTDGSDEAYFGDADANGQYYKMNDGQDDNSSGIFCKITSRPYAMGQPLLTKLYKRTRIFAEASDDTYNLEFCAVYDLSSEEELCELFTVAGVGNKWDEHNWVDDAETESDPLIWAGPALSELVYDPHRKAKFMQLIFKQTEADAPVTLLGWGVSGSQFGGQ